MKNSNIFSKKELGSCWKVVVSIYYHSPVAPEHKLLRLNQDIIRAQQYLDNDQLLQQFLEN